MSQENWSQWLNFSQDMFTEIPNSSGVFMMHQAMKILYIGGSSNLKNSILEMSNDPCASKATRFRYKEEKDYEKVCNELIEDFKKRHEGNLPGCMK